MSSVTWSREGEAYQASVDVCVRIGDRINLSNLGKQGEDRFSGRLTFLARRGTQRAVGIWQWDGANAWNAKVSGKVTKLSREQLEFEGSWDENDGAPGDLFVECSLGRMKTATPCHAMSWPLPSYGEIAVPITESLPRPHTQLFGIGR